MTDLISIIITCYNQCQMIDKAIKSVIEQSYSNWECVIVDDGSTDESKHTITKYCMLDKRIKYIFQENSGVAAARNKGFHLSTGNYIQFLDGDDWIVPEKFDLQLSIFKKNPSIDICYTDHEFFVQNKNIYKHFDFEILNGKSLNKILFKWDRGVSLPIHTALIKRTIWGVSEEPFDSNYKGRYEDWIFWVNLALKNSEFFFFNKVLAIYNIHESNFCNNHSDSLKNFLIAAFHIKSKLPIDMQDVYINESINYAFDKHALNKQNEELQNSFCRKLTNKLYRLLKKLSFNQSSY